MHAKKRLPKGYKKPEVVLPPEMGGAPEEEALASDVEDADEAEAAPAATVFQQKTVAIPVPEEARVASIPTEEVEVVSNTFDVKALDDDITAFETKLSMDERGGAVGAMKFAQHLANIKRGLREFSVSDQDAEALELRLVRSRQLAFVSVELGLSGLIFTESAIADALTRSTAELEELKARALGIMQTGVDCGQHLQPEARRHLAQLAQSIDAELAKPERAKPAKQPCEGPQNWPEGKPSTTELNAAVDSLGVDPGAATVAAPSVPPPAEEAPLPLVVKKDDGSEQWTTGIHEASPTAAFVPSARETAEMTTKAIRTPIPPAPEPSAALVDPFDAAVAEATALADRLLAETPSIPPAGPDLPEPEPQADPALAQTEAAMQVTPPEGVAAAPASPTAPLGGLIGQTQVGNPTGSQPATPLIEPPPPPADQNDGLDEVAKLVLHYVEQPVTQRLKSENRQNFPMLIAILNTETKSDKPAIAQRARDLKEELETAFQIAEFANRVGVILNGKPPEVAVIATLPDDLVAVRIKNARDFMDAREQEPLTPEVVQKVLAFLKSYEEAQSWKLNPHPTPDPGTPHSAGSRPAMPAPAPTPPPAPASQPAAATPKPTPAATPQAKAAEVPKSEALTGIAPAVPPAAPAAPLPSPVINAPPASPPSVEVRPSIVPAAPSVSAFNAMVGGQTVRPGMQVGMHETPSAKAEREAADLQQQEERVRRKTAEQEIARRQQKATIKRAAWWIVGSLASVFVGGAIVLGVLMFYRRLNHQEALLNKLTSQSDEVSQAMRIAARERARTVVADAAAAQAREQLAAASGGTSGLRCSPASQRPGCSNLPPDTHQSPTGPGYYCPPSAPMTPLGSGGYDACHCEWCQ